MNTTQTSPYMMPAEWQTHERTFISWPIQASMCYPDSYASVCAGYAGLIEAIAEFEPITVLVNPDELAQVAARFAAQPQVTCLPIAHNDAWLRDNGPTFVHAADGSLVGINWRFNAWGGKYSPWDLDDAVAPQLLDELGIPRIDAPLVLEGGSIHVDGCGTLLTTEECLLNDNRNPDMDRAAIEAELRRYLGVQAFIWLKQGLSGDETDGHIDNVACFAAPGQVLLQVCNDPADANYAITEHNRKTLREARDARGQALEVIEIEQPPYREHEGQRLTLSYLNFYFVGGGIILPVFGGAAAETDKLAAEQLAALYPNRRIHTVDGMAVIHEGGNVHCTTQQMPTPRQAAFE
jgi:agmatine deiminase